MDVHILQLSLFKWPVFCSWSRSGAADCSDHCQCTRNHSNRGSGNNVNRSIPMLYKSRCRRCGIRRSFEKCARDCMRNFRWLRLRVQCKSCSHDTRYEDRMHVCYDFTFITLLCHAGLDELSRLAGMFTLQMLKFGKLILHVFSLQLNVEPTLWLCQAFLVLAILYLHALAILAGEYI